MKTLSIALLMALAAPAMATSYQTYGNTTYGSNGVTIQQYGNTAYVSGAGSASGAYQTYGNTTYGPNGSTTTNGVTAPTTGWGSPGYGVPSATSNWGPR